MRTWTSNRCPPTSTSSAPPANLSIDTVSGEVSVAGAPREANIESVSGDLRVTLNSREVSVETVSGDVSCTASSRGRCTGNRVRQHRGRHQRQALRRLAASTVSGDTTVHAGLLDGGEIKAETVSGDLHLRLPKVARRARRAEASAASSTRPARRSSVEVRAGLELRTPLRQGLRGDPHRDVLRRCGTDLRVKAGPGHPGPGAKTRAVQRCTAFFFSEPRLHASPRRLARWPSPPAHPTPPCANASARCATSRRSCARSGRPAAHHDRQPRPAHHPRVAAGRDALRRQADHRRGGAPGRARARPRRVARWVAQRPTRSPRLAARLRIRARRRSPTCSAAWCARPTRCCRKNSPTRPACG